MISILMPLKNASLYLEECIESIVNQSTKDWELIVINDHSTDSGQQILENYTRVFSNISLFDNKEQGIIPALTLAYARAKGEFITRMDADDIMSKDKLEKLREGLKENPEAIISSRVSYFSEQSLGDGYKRYEDWLNARMDLNDHYQHIYKECVLPSPNWMMTRNTLNRLGGFSALNYPEDYDLCFRAYSQKIPLLGLPFALHKWRDYPERTSRNDKNYRDNAFLKLKIDHFLDIDYLSDCKLVVWGAGKKGKKIAQLLIEANIDFSWLTNNEKKIGTSIYNMPLQPTQSLCKNSTHQLILAVASPSDQLEIKKQLKNARYIQEFWFC